MEIDARTIREVEFREKIRGYNPDDVDDFLEQVAVTFEAMQDRLKATPARESALQEPVTAVIETKDLRSVGSVVSTPIDRSRSSNAAEFDDDIIQRTLLLAQKTADSMIAQAEEQAAATVQEAKSKADALLSQAQQRAREIVDSAVNQARGDALDLTKSKDRLLSELNQLNSRVASARSQVKDVLESILDQIDGSFGADVLVKVPGSPSATRRTQEMDAGVDGTDENLFAETNSANGSGVFDDESD